jgi:hypothetical protein
MKTKNNNVSKVRIRRQGERKGKKNGEGERKKRSLRASAGN